MICLELDYGVDFCIRGSWILFIVMHVIVSTHTSCRLLRALLLMLSLLRLLFKETAFSRLGLYGRMSCKE